MKKVRLTATVDYSPWQDLLRWFIPAVTVPANATVVAHHPDRRPLRVVRILEAGQLPMHGGRLRISGRMADVCAELDRLVAGESRLH
ncbi:MAG: hypothetical protein ACI9I0_000154 [Rhodoferax sp.]|jgi:hypothetical protein